MHKPKPWVMEKTYRSSLRPNTLISRQHSFISLLVAGWDSRSVLSKAIWMKTTRVRISLRLQYTSDKQNVQTASISLWLEFKVIQRAHLAGFAQEVYGVVGFQKGCHCETVVKCQITVFVALRLKRKSSCLVRDACNIFGIKCLFQSKYNIFEWELSQLIDTIQIKCKRQVRSRKVDFGFVIVTKKIFLKWSIKRCSSSIPPTLQSTCLWLLDRNQLLHGFGLHLHLFERMFGVKELTVDFVRGQKTW